MFFDCAEGEEEPADGERRMAALILDKSTERRLIARRRRLGIDRFDEVWEGVYVMSPPADIEHFGAAKDLAAVLTIVVKWAGLGEVFAGVAISDRKQDWKRNFRVPDVTVFLKGNPAEDCGTHWFGGPDLAVEIVSPNDRTRKKIPFYERVGTRELLIVDRRPWRVTLLRLSDGKLHEIGQSTLADSQTLASEVVPLCFQLVEVAGRQAIFVRHLHDQRQWTVEARQRR
jgi:Uma2 family endonuclease